MSPAMIVNQVVREYNGLGQLTREWQAQDGPVGSSTPSVQHGYSFNAQGTGNHSRITNLTYPNGRVLSYNYGSGIDDSMSRLTSIVDGLNALERYDYLGAGTVVRRGSTQTGVDLYTSTKDLYYSSNWQVLEEHVNSSPRLSYAWSPVYVDAMIARDRDTDNNGTLDERLYAAHDANFNVSALINTSGNIVERFQYDPFGRYDVLDDSWGSRSSSNYAWNYLHQGGRWDSDAGVYSFRHREYSPTLGRWATMDPIGFAAGDVNLYRSYHGNSISILDPSGLDGIGYRIDFKRVGGATQIQYISRGGKLVGSK